MRAHGITKQFTIWCDVCADWWQGNADTVIDFRRQTRAVGWISTRRKALCPACAKKAG